ncbi:MAG: DUF1501 domain-containing protein [Fuerstiella sp.]|nr:DUF1501 domain-containing protein [Fuerstiella sp.]
MTVQHHHHLDRRSFFDHVGSGLYGAALAQLLGGDLIASESSHNRPVHNLLPQQPVHEPKAKAMIHLFMNGGPSQMDLFDPKPELTKRHGEPYFKKIAGEVEFIDSVGALKRSPYKFRQHGECGMSVSEVMPHLAQQVDDIALIRSMHTTTFAHEHALYKIHSGRMLSAYPSLGSWVTYGLGSENQNLPAYVVLDDPGGLPVNGVENWQAGFLPPVYQGTRFRSTGSPVLDLEPGTEKPEKVVKLQRDLLNRLDNFHRKQRPGQPVLDARIANYELAARMQLEANDTLDLSQESEETLEMYGINDPKTESYGRRCLIARRLVESGVRFVQLYIRSQIWDSHRNLASGLRSACEFTDKPVAALLKDLRQRGLIDSTLVVWGGEFGRLPIAQLAGSNSEKTSGRDHNKNAMVTWFAGAGIKGGTQYGTTDELGFAAEENKVSVQDWHATILHLLGLDHEKLLLERLGLEEKLTHVFEAHIIDGILS